MLSLILWAVFALPLWHALAAVPAAAVSPEHQGLVLLAGFIGSTFLMYQVDRRVVPMGGFRQWRIPRAWMAGAAFVAGCGATILASEVGNIALSMVESLREPPAEKLQLTPVVAALLGGIVHPVCMMLVLNDLVQRTFRLVHKPPVAMAFTIVLGALTSGMAAFPQWVVVLALPAWLYRHSQSPTLSVVAFLPWGFSAALTSLGVGPGIPGFDMVDDTTVLWQPIWFDVLGGVLVAAGVVPFLQAFVPAAGPPESKPDIQS